MAEDNTITATNGKKRKHHHQFSKPMKKGRSPLRAGVEGFFITCDRGKERQTTDEALNLLYCFYEELLHGDAAFPNVANEQTNGVIKFTDTDSSDHDNESPQKEGVNFQNEANDTEEAPLKKQHVDVEADEPKCQNASHEKAEMKPIDELVEEKLKDIGDKNKDDD
ncbi:hypothetical protein QJS04_geneDACA003681 [Acorus gramineus]|uniref:Uncharacterized protein n=1 Tax=Acorus gramineus TaxID=55184 RepID=A0AAV9BPM5_ACOGR|nr:hypothetical protein QJS04_geneDACA003681 [Acorus gramineus]